MTAKARATLQTDITNNITTNATGDITGAILNTLLDDVTDSHLNTITDLIGQAEAEAGVATTVRVWTAERVAQAIAALGGDVTKVGTPVDNQLAVWTGDGTVEGDTGLTWDGSNLELGANGLKVGSFSLGGSTFATDSGDTSITLNPDGTGVIRFEASLYIVEQAAASADEVGRGQIWVKDTTPNELWFTNDAGTDIQLGSVSAVGTPVNNQLAVWTGDGTLEGDTGLTWDGSNLELGANGIKVGSFSLGGSTFATDSGNTSITLDPNGSGVIRFQAALYIVEQAGASADEVGHGQIWIKNTTPNQLWFTDDAGTDARLDIIGKAEIDVGAHSIGFTAQSATGDGTTTIDWKLGNKFNFQFGAFNETFTFTAPTKPGNFTLKLVQDSVGSRTVTWPGTVKWPGGTAPTLTTTATTGTDIVSFYYDGTSYFGVASADFS